MHEKVLIIMQMLFSFVLLSSNIISESLSIALNYFCTVMYMSRFRNNSVEKFKDFIFTKSKVLTDTQLQMVHNFYLSIFAGRNNNQVDDANIDEDNI